MRSFAGIDLWRYAAPDKTTILDSRRLLEKHELNGEILAGAIVDATTIAAASSAKNSAIQRCSRPKEVTSTS
jgi:hypothetical protein